MWCPAVVARMGDGRGRSPSSHRCSTSALTIITTCTRAVTAAGALRARDLTDKLIAMIDDVRLRPRRLPQPHQEQASALVSVRGAGRNRRSARGRALGTIVASGHKDLTARAMASASAAWATPALVDVLLPRFPGQFSRPAMFALARIGDERALEPMDGAGRPGCAARRKGWSTSG